MTPILVYGFPSGSSMGLIAALEWLGKPYRLCRVDMFGEMRDPAYAKLNPRIETPAFITDQGDVLTETMAIAAWLETRDTERRISFDPLTRDADRMHQLMAFINTGFTGAFSPLWAAMEMEVAEPAVQAAWQKLGMEGVLDRHDKLESLIEGGPYLLGDRPTLADGILIGVARWLEFHNVAEIARWPKIAAIRQVLEADPAVVFATGLENGEHLHGSGFCQGHVALADVIEKCGA